ncbi:piggyBac transposable element-derived protein 4-like [Acyrthosiphon pisum]|uniref:PiggyBac transposable element-derived protein domain-containing protein n=1 Tax=Acyrthosiphon pisum TaxID=7029 RepID=A0A8R1X1E4_ACYPI|nr:piggyBac transposable element-derived protein 4-like [Acyrthosiphon pisum]|eukprot:XP_008179963.1 PREDICTED: piggyBac transposable element-derived protein 4-like [Acyrthosiphon pisum]
MNANQISDLLDLSSSDSFDEVYSSDEYVLQDSDSNNSDKIIEDSDADVEITDNDWNSDINTMPKLFDFTGNSGLQYTLSTKNPLDYFNLFFDDNIMNNIVTWVNLRANTLKSLGVRKHSNLSNWKNIDVYELKKFIGLTLLMGIHKLPTIHLYWSKSEIDYHPIYGQTLSRNRYETILRCLCFYEPSTTDKSDRLHKINNVLGPIISNIQTKRYPKECLSLDESMLLWRGRLSFRQYIPSKALKYGIKCFELCTDDGFILDLIIYKGTGTDSRGVTFGIVNKLMKNYFGQGHTLYMDNYYNSV